MSTQTKEAITPDQAKALFEDCAKEPQRRFVRFVIEPCSYPGYVGRPTVAAYPPRCSDDLWLAHAPVRFLDASHVICCVWANECLARLVAVATSCGWTVERHTATEALLSKPEGA